MTNRGVEQNKVLDARGDECLLCGECLSHCPYIKMDKKEAADEMKALRAGAPSRKLLLGCYGCYTCDVYCQRDLKPYSLIRAMWLERYKKKGLPARAAFMMPHRFPNFRTAIDYSSHEQALHRRFALQPTTDNIFYTGCNLLVMSYLLDSRLLDDYSIFGRWDLCCGEMYYRMGLIDHAMQAAQRLSNALKEFQPQRITVACTACYNMLKNIYPNELGIHLDAQVSHLAYDIREGLNMGTLKVVRPLKASFVVQDSCHGKVVEPDLAETIRGLIRLCGVKILEMEHNHKDSLCCGVAAGCTSFSPLDMARAGFMRLGESSRISADYLMAYCTGCQLTLGVLDLLYPRRKKPVIHLLDLLDYALNGKEMRIPMHVRRYKQMLWNVVKGGLPGIFSKRRFYLDDIESS